MSVKGVIGSSLSLSGRCWSSIIPRLWECREAFSNKTFMSSSSSLHVLFPYLIKRHARKYMHPLTSPDSVLTCTTMGHVRDINEEMEPIPNRALFAQTCCGWF
ncbi:hypothetical protein HYPSUDRAFT_67558 [Hypholoma sublateritium FD-334 SS-4]|uniref:Uncharacterized protein n=1 Tax=Hypholoma sublateritium (strain FD-334 SS-4) TaxID=945553 RepID=A0A0D2NYU9_HYPSF|nr:hypothetical protein HYPSUDRAFT_67558 [Hypholoma sublateritium FD-334 SS-4]